MRRKKTLIISSAVLIILISGFFLSSSRKYRIEAFEDFAYEVTKIVITNTSGETLTLDAKESQALIDSLHPYNMNKADDRIKTPFSNTIDFHIKNRRVISFKAGDPSILDRKSQLIYKGDAYTVYNGFYNDLKKTCKKHNFSISTL